MSNIDKAMTKANDWLDRKGVQVVAQSEQDGKDCILVLVDEPYLKEIQKSLPEEVDGIPVIIQGSGGEVRPL